MSPFLFDIYKREAEVYRDLDKDFFGFTDLEGRLPSEVPRISGIWQPNRVWLEDGYVCFDVPEGDLGLSPDRWGWIKQEPGAYLLDAFVRLKNPKQIAHFAEKYGPLYLCATHKNPYDLWHPTASGCNWQPFEPVSWWLWHVESVRAALSAAVLLRQGKPVPPETWRAMGWPADIAQDGGYWTSRLWLASTINGWIAEEKGGPRLWATNDLSITINAGLGVLRAIWLLVAQTVARERAIFVCAGCGNLHTRPIGVRLPKEGENAYCPTCRKTYAPAKKMSAARRREQLRTLIAFVDLHKESSWAERRLLWNEKYPLWHYESDADMETDYTARAATYGVRKGGH